MKVELDDIRLGYSSLTGNVLVGIPLKDNQWRHKKEVTSDFIGCVILKFGGFKEVFTFGEDKYEIIVKKISSHDKSNSK